MAVEFVTGSADPIETGASTVYGDTPTKVITVEGPMSLLENVADVTQFVPSGFEYDTHRVIPTGDGFGKIEISCKDFGTDVTGTTPTRTTWKIQMACVQKDLKLHPKCVAARDDIERWLATDINKRYNNGDKTKPQYVDENGNSSPISANEALDYIHAYNAGIETYNEYYPVLQKISYYKRLPGVGMKGKSTTSGKVTAFSPNVGKWNTPDVTLNGYADTGWFMSGDGYDQDNSLVWTRTEEWTWSPNGSNDKNTGWIYESSQS